MDGLAPTPAPSPRTRRSRDADDDGEHHTSKRFILSMSLFSLGFLAILACIVGPCIAHKLGRVEDDDRFSSAASPPDALVHRPVARPPTPPPKPVASVFDLAKEEHKDGDERSPSPSKPGPKRDSRRSVFDIIEQGGGGLPRPPPARPKRKSVFDIIKEGNAADHAHARENDHGL